MLKSFWFFIEIKYYLIIFFFFSFIFNITLIFDIIELSLFIVILQMLLLNNYLYPCNSHPIFNFNLLFLNISKFIIWFIFTLVVFIIFSFSWNIPENVIVFIILFKEYAFVFSKLLKQSLLIITIKQSLSWIPIHVNCLQKLVIQMLKYHLILFDLLKISDNH